MIKIYGASDDMLEIEGDISEEFNPPDDKPCFLAISDGTLLRVVYDDDGIWRITKMFPGSANFSKVEGSVAEDTNDVVTLFGVDISWVVLGEAVAK